MSITTELREWVKSLYTPNSGELKLQAERIADRIDAEHQKALDEWKAEHGQMWLKGYSECHAELMEGNETLASDLEGCGWVRLPLGADGEPIHVGDSVEIIGGEYGTAVAIELCEDGGWNVSMRPTGWDTPTLFAAESVRHHHPPTVEDVLREMIDELFVDVCDDPDATIAEYAARLRLAGEDE